MTDQKTISVYDTQVDNYAELVNKQTVDDTLLNFISRFKPNDFILDLGCGPASSSATMREHGLRVDPTDASIEMVKLANKTFNIGARQLLFEELDATNTYNGIWANFSLLHASREEFPSILSSLHLSLKPNGLLHIGMKLGTGSARDKLDRYYTYYSEQELRDLLAQAGFNVEREEQGEALGLAGSKEPWVALQSTA